MPSGGFSFTSRSIILKKMENKVGDQVMSAVPLLDLNPHWLSGVFSCAIVGVNLFSKTRAKILPAMERGVMPP